MHHWICPIRLFRHDSVYYRLQRSCGKVIFSQASVRHSVHGGCGRHHAWADTPLADTPWADLPGQTPHQADTPRQIPPLGRHPQPSACWDTRPPAATAADGTHPTGMHSCFEKKKSRMFRSDGNLPENV